MRRVALVLCLLLLAPVSGSFSLPDIPEIEGEWVVVHEGGWTHTDWMELRDGGLEPLRQISETEVLVWGTYGDFQLDESRLLRGIVADGYRVVLEPRLPSHAQWDILSAFDIENLQLAGEASSLPTSFEIHGVDSVVFDSIPGVWWVEPLLETKARNNLAAQIMGEDMGGLGTFWDTPWGWELNGSGVIIGVADSGIELDHGCFRENATEIGDIGIEHRKVVFVNTTIDDGDHSGHADYKHGTHIAGSLVCDMWNGTVTEGTSPSHGARVLFQDVVNESGWSEPTVDWLLAEALANGAVIHSDSWGDDTEAYTLRSAEFDLWHREVPWSLAFIAPGNNPSKFYEPANARNVVSVGGTLSDNSTNLYTSSSQGPTEEGLRGNFIVAPAVGIMSAAADGDLSSFNDDLRSSTGTSMSTPLGASITAVIQQSVQMGLFLTTENEGLEGQYIRGFVPSGPLLRALLAMSAESLPEGFAPDGQQGWGRPLLTNLFDYWGYTTGPVWGAGLPWIHDTYMMNETARMLLVDEWLSTNGSRPLEQVVTSMWNGSGAQGPFLKQGENVSWNLTLGEGQDLDVVLSFNQRPFGSVSDDLDVAVILPNGTRISSNESLEGTEQVRVPGVDLVGIESVVIEVSAELVGVGNYTDVLGSDGDMLGFGLAVTGVLGEVFVPEPEPPIHGCMDSSAVNYNGLATVDDGACQYPVAPVEGCMDIEAENYNEYATIDDGVCVYPFLESESKVLIIGIDGVRADVAELSSQREGSAFSHMVENGAWTYDSKVGPISLSGPSWSSMLTGEWCDRHGVTDNSFEGSRHSSVPDFFEVVEDSNPNMRTASVVYWSEIDEEIIGEGVADIQERYDLDVDIRDRAIELISQDQELDVLFVSLDNPDSKGHEFGFSPDVPEYVAAVEQADDMAASILAALEARNLGEDWLVIITSDHGGGGERIRAHSPSTEIDRTTFMMVKGGDTVRGEMNGSQVVDVAVTTLVHLNLSGVDTGPLDGRPLAFNHSADPARVPVCVRMVDDESVLTVMGVDLMWWHLGVMSAIFLLIGAASFSWYIRRKGSDID